MRSRADLARTVLEHAHRTATENLRAVTHEEALRAAGGYRSILGILKHAAAWTHIYHSYAFDIEPRHWAGLAWPRGLPPDVIDPSPGYLEDVRAWLEHGCDLWDASLAALPDAALDEPRPLHWGATAPLWDIVVIVAGHLTYHTGELNAVLSIERGEAWEYTEEVEENHIPTAGHRLRPGWMTEEQAARYEAYRTLRDAEIQRDIAR